MSYYTGCYANRSSRLSGGAADLVAVAEALLAGGITLFEFTATTPGALEAIAQCRTRFGDQALIGMGTVLDRPPVRCRARIPAANL